MIEYLQPADRPVVDRLEHEEIIYAKDQPQYVPIRILLSKTPEGCALSRWTLTPEQRAAVAAGNDIFLEILTFGVSLAPMRMSVRDDMPAMAEWVACQYRLDARLIPAPMNGETK